MSRRKAEAILNLANNGLILKNMNKSANQLQKEGYLKLDRDSLARFSPVIEIIEGIGFQQLANASVTKEVEKVLKGSYRCIVDGKVLQSDILAKAKKMPLYRGFILGNGGIARQAAWEKIDPKQIVDTLGKAPAPNIVAIIFQVLSIATSQYYMHQMNQNYQIICTEIKAIEEQFMIQDASEIIAGYKSLTSMVNHFDSIMDSDNRRQSESIKAGQIEFEALKQIERCKLKLEKNYILNPKKDSVEKIHSNVTGIINTLAQLKMSVYVYGISKSIRVCFDEITSVDEISDFISEINEQIDLYKDTIRQLTESLDVYVSESKALNKFTIMQKIKLAGVGLLASGISFSLTAIIEYDMVKEMNDNRTSQKNCIEKQIQENISWDDLETLSSSIRFLEAYASSLDSELEIVSKNKEYYILPKKLQ